MISKYKICLLFAGVLIISVLFASCTADKGLPRKLNFNGGWKFYRGEVDSTRVIEASFSDSGWTGVHLPHAAGITPLDHPWPLPETRGINWYRKEFQLAETYRGNKIMLEFEGADQVAEVWLNGKKLIRHQGSFTPFVLDITDYVVWGKTLNLIVVRVNNLPDRNIPVYGNWISYGGLYRDVYLHICNPLHITNASFADRVAGGGLFITYPLVSDSLAEIKIQTQIKNEYLTIVKSCLLKSTVLDKNGQRAGSVETVQTVASGCDCTFTQTIKIKNPQLWHPDHPYLYTLVSEVFQNGQPADRQNTRIGIRQIGFDPVNGFSINGKRLKFMGTNRVQDYPYVAWAFPNTAQRRDAIHLREAGFQYVRLSHNLQDPSFLEACDELGLLVMACIPGFQFIGGPEFRENSFGDMRKLIRRDRNHPAIILWELSLNETDYDSAFAQRAMQIGHEEFPGDQCFVSGWKFDQIYDVYIRATQHGARNYLPGAPLVISEYGHWDYGEGHSSSDVNRRDGEQAMLIQAHNHQESLNKNRALPFLCGDGLWVGIDFQIFPSGVIDYFRLPKFSYYFYQSQRDPYLLFENINSGPMVFIANYWDDDSPRDVRVFSNCDSVQLWLNGKRLAGQTPDQDSLSNYLLHPPFTFKNLPWQAGELKAVGFLAGKPAGQHIRRTPGEIKSIELEFEFKQPPCADGEELFFAYARIVDQDGTTVPTAARMVQFDVQGPAKLLSPEKIKTEAGIAAALLQVGTQAGEITLQASSADLPAAEIKAVTTTEK
jgi:beta-galactosidase